MRQSCEESGPRRTYTIFSLNSGQRSKNTPDASGAWPLTQITAAGWLVPILGGHVSFCCGCWRTWRQQGTFGSFTWQDILQDGRNSCFCGDQTAARESDLDARSGICIFQPQHATKFLDPLSHTSNAHANAATLKLRDTFANALPVVADRDDELADLVLESNPPIPRS